jgi:hypothetical protein
MNIQVFPEKWFFLQPSRSTYQINQRFSCLADGLLRIQSSPVSLEFLVP